MTDTPAHFFFIPMSCFFLAVSYTPFIPLNSALTDKQDSLNGGSFAGGGNIDNIRKNTVVWADSSSSETLPYNDYALILVISDGVNTVQVWFPFAGINPVSWRMHVNGAWQDWRHL